MADKKPNIPRSAKDVETLNKSFSQGYDSLLGRSSNPENRRQLDAITHQMDAIIDRELSSTKSITSDEMSTFLVKMFNEYDKTSMPVTSYDDIFQPSDSGLFSFFQERYQNQNLLYDDLNMIVEQLAELREAVATTRDAIVTADDITKTVSRSITFENIRQDDPNIATAEEVINAMEEQYKLPKKIKGQIISNTLKYGRYYVYVIPYSELFEQQYKHKLKDPTRMATSVKESLNVEDVVSMDKVLTESSNEFFTEWKNELKDIKCSVNEKDLKKHMSGYCENITVTKDISSIPLIEGTDVTQLFDAVKFSDHVKDVVKSKKSHKTINDAVLDIDKQAEGKFDNINDCYIKLIDPRRVVPVKILDTTLGYYYIHETDLKRDKAPFSTTISISQSTNSGYSEDVEMTFLSRITDKIIDAFDPKFVEKNQKFKDLILNSLMYNNIYEKQLNFQFIPAEYMVEFTVNEDENGEGQSILMGSLFYAKLYLAMLVFKIISMVTRSNDTRVIYVKNGGIDANITNKIQDVARSMKARQINFMDLLNYNSIISKLGAYKDVYMPVGRSGERAIEFDTIAGQQVDFNSDLMDFLRTNMINATGVPSVIMNYINEADYAKSIQMGNTKFANRTLNLQLDLNPSLTELYQKILRFSGAPLEDRVISALRYNLNPPTALSAQNSADDINTKDQLILAIVKTKIGDNENDDIANIARDYMYTELAREYIPNLNWTRIDDLHKRAIMFAEQKMIEKGNDQ